MFIRVIKARYNPQNEVEVVRLGQEQLTPAYQRLPGFQGQIIGVDRNAGRTFSVTTWDTDEHARTVREGLGDVMSQLQAVGVDFDTPPEIYEVVQQS